MLTFVSVSVSIHGEFSATTELPEGRYEYKFHVDGKWMHDPDGVSGFMILA